MSSSLDDLTAKVKIVSDTYAERCNINRDADWYALKLQEELGEMVAEYLRGSGRGRIRGAEADVRRAIEDEAADVLAQLLLFIDANGIDIESALERKWFKYMDKAAGTQ